MIEIKDGKMYDNTLNGIREVEIGKGDSIYISNYYIDKVALTLGGYRFDIEKSKFVFDKNGDWICDRIYWDKNPDKKWFEFWKPKQICTGVTLIRRK